jgi:hypothetical protein
MRRFLFVVMFVMCATPAWAANVETHDNIFFRPFNPVLDFAGTLSFMNRSGEVIATLTDKGVLTALQTAGPVTLVPARTILYAAEGDLVIARSQASVASVGPSIDGVTLRVRLGSKFGTYKLVAIGGAAFNKEVTIVDNIPALGVTVTGQ